MKKDLIIIFVIFLVFLNSNAFAQVDYVLQNYEKGGTGFIPPFGGQKYTCYTHSPSNLIGIQYWSIPPVVRPGQRCRTVIKWSVWTNHVPITYVNYFGDWQPNTELARGSLYDDVPNPGDEYTDSFSFTAPYSPGSYRIRFMWYLAYYPIPNFYGAKDRLPHGFSEILFKVE